MLFTLVTVAVWEASFQRIRLDFNILDAGFEHILTDLPSVDPEEDAGALAAHRIWWQYPQNTRRHATITELIFVPEAAAPGLYYLQLILPKIHSDAVPSQPLIYPLYLDV